MRTQPAGPLPMFSCCRPQNRDAEFNSDCFVAYVFTPGPNPSDLKMVSAGPRQGELLCGTHRGHLGQASIQDEDAIPLG